MFFNRQCINKLWYVHAMKYFCDKNELFIQEKMCMNLNAYCILDETNIEMINRSVVAGDSGNGGQG